MHHFSRYLIIVTLILVFCASGCAHKPPATIPVVSANEPADLRTFPQNLEIYAQNAGKDKRLLDQAAQNMLNDSFDQILFGPWHMSRTSMSRREFSSSLKKMRGYKFNATPWTQSEWDFMRQNANLGSFPSRALPAITLRNTDLREVPTHEASFSKPTLKVAENPFDNFQYSLLPVGTPLLIVHTSLDGRWHLVECPVAGGWVDAKDVGYVDDAFVNLWQTGKYAALITDNVTLPGTGRDGGDSKAGIGTVLPIISSNSNSLNVLVPRSGSSGYAESAEITLSATVAERMPVPLTPGNIARIGNVMMNQPYGWGGMNGNRDCSATMREIFTPFGLWLPRNSAAQAKRGAIISLAGMSQSEKANTILQYGTPFLSLLGMKGHITLYIGKWEGKPAIFHNVWGLRVHKNGNDNERCVIGRAVVTSITPGIELENLYRPVTFVDRLRTMTTVGK